MIKRIAIITSGYLPVPDTRGGAVEALDTALINENELRHTYDFVIFSVQDAEARARVEVMKHSEGVYINIPWFVRIMDSAIYGFAKYVMRKRKLMSYRYIAQRLWYIRQVAKHLRDEHFDAVMIENHATLFMTMKLYGNAKKYDGKVYYHLHNEVPQLFGCREEIRSVKKVLGVSDFIVRTLESSVGPLRPDQKAVWRNCVDVESFRSENALAKGRELRNRYGISDDDVVFLFSGRLTEEKGVEPLLRAFARLSDLPQAKLVIAGAYFFNSGIASPFEERLHALAESLGDRVIFTGFIPHDDMPGVYAMSDVCCMPSLWDDPAPLAVIEAMAAGKPLITTYSGGIPEYVNEQCAVLLRRDEKLEQNLKDAMSNLACDSNRKIGMGQAGNDIVDELDYPHYLSDMANYLR